MKVNVISSVTVYIKMSYLSVIHLLTACSEADSLICEFGVSEFFSKSTVSVRCDRFPTVVDYRSERVKLVAVIIHIVQSTILEAVYSDSLSHFAGNV
jgi:hypothetical protein